MPEPNRPPLPRRRAPAGFQPRIALGMLYVVGFFFLFALLMVLPELLDVLEQVPSGPEQQQLAEDAAHEAIGSKIYVALAGAILLTGLGGYFQVLPGLKTFGN